ncbi:MAG TPA: hypothetical protein VIF12_06625, partial [Micavibrio sp.]
MITGHVYCSEDIMMKSRIVTLLFMISFLLPMFGYAETKPCDVMAVMFGKPVCREEFLPADAAFIDTLEVPDEQKKTMKEQIAGRNVRRMEALLWQR